MAISRSLAAHLFHRLSARRLAARQTFRRPVRPAAIATRRRAPIHLRTVMRDLGRQRNALAEPAPRLRYRFAFQPITIVDFALPCSSTVFGLVFAPRIESELVSGLQGVGRAAGVKSPARLPPLHSSSAPFRILHHRWHRPRRRRGQAPPPTPCRPWPLTDLGNLFGLVRVLHTGARGRGQAHRRRRRLGRQPGSPGGFPPPPAARPEPGGLSQLCELLTRAYLVEGRRDKAEIRREWLVEVGRRFHRPFRRPPGRRRRSPGQRQFRPSPPNVPGPGRLSFPAPST